MSELLLSKFREAKSVLDDFLPFLRHSRTTVASELGWAWDVKSEMPLPPSYASIDGRILNRRDAEEAFSAKTRAFVVSGVQLVSCIEQLVLENLCSCRGSLSTSTHVHHRGGLGTWPNSGHPNL